jgi:hypothetical protein
VRKIDIFVSSPDDVQKERSLVERVIRSIAAEFGVPVTVNYSNWLRKVNPSDKVPAQNTNGLDEGRTWLRPCFWEYQNSTLDQDYREQIPNTGSYDLVVSILWSKLGTKLSPAFIMPDGTTPKTANEYEIAWVLDQLARTPDFPELHVYRNRSTPTAPVQPRDQRETFFREWDAVQDFFLAWERQPGFTQACNDYSDLQEFESLFREHFREFLKRQVEKEIVPRKTPARGRSWEFNPFRGLQYFDFEHAPIFHGRTKAVGEVVDALNDQAIAKMPFVLILGPSGSGKTSLVRGGVLPLLTELATVMGEGLWRRAITRPGSGADPFVALAAALLADRALPELQEGTSREAHRTLAEELRDRPDALASRIGEALDQISTQELDLLLTREKDLSPATGRIESVELARHRRLQRAKPKAQLAIFVDQLEDLFSSNYPEKTQQSYISTIAALVRSQKVHIIAALRSEFYGSYRQFPELIALTNPTGRFDLQAPTQNEIRRMIRSPAQASGLKFEQETKSGKSLDDTLVDAALGSTDSLPLLEHLLSQLFIRQAGRKDGLLRWADYQDLHAFAGALPEHAEVVFNSLSIDAQEAFDFVMRKLVFLEHDGRAGCRPVPYQDLVSSHEVDSHLQTSTQTFVDRMVAEGLFNAETDHKQDLVVQVAHPALLRNWPRVQEWLSADQEFVRMRDRVDGCLKLWLKKGRQTHDLLTPGLSLADGETLLNHFHSSLSAAQIEYIQKSLTSQKRSRRTTFTVLVAVLVALACVATIAAVERLTSDGKRAIILEYGNLERKIAELVQNGHETNRVDATQGQNKSPQASPPASASAAQRSTLETELTESQNKLQQVQHDADLAAAQVNALQEQLKLAQQKLQANQQDGDAATTQRSALETQVKALQEKLQEAEQASALATSQRSGSETQLKETQEKLQQVQGASGLAIAQIASLQAQLKQAQEKLQQNEQVAADPASSQLSTLQAQLKQAQDKLEQDQQTTDAAASKLSTVGAQLKDAQDKLEQSQQTAETIATQRSALEAQLKDARTKLQQSEQASDAATSRRSTLEAQLKQAQDNLQLAQAAAGSDSAQRSSLEAQLKQAQDKLEQNQQTTDAATSKLSTVGAQLKEAQDKLEQNQQTADAAASKLSNFDAQIKETQAKLERAQQTAETIATQRSALEAQLKDARSKLQQSEQASDAATSQRSTLEAKLKQAQDKQQLAEQNANQATARTSTLQAQMAKFEESARLTQQQADEATSQRSALEAQLKQAESQAQLAQKIADLVAAQARSTANGTSPSDPQNGNTEPAQQGRSGLALPLDAGQDPGAKPSTQPLSPPAEPPNQ